MIVASTCGGTSIEDLAEKYPEKIIKIPVDIRTGITDEQVGTDGGLGGGTPQGAAGSGAAAADRSAQSASSHHTTRTTGVS